MRFEKGRQAEYKVLNDTWELVGDKSAMQGYVEREVRELPQEAHVILSATAVLTAVWLGILTSISPCPLATNVAAMSFIGKDLGSPRTVLLTGLLYTAGRSLAYAVLAALLIASIFAIPDLSFWLSTYMNHSCSGRS